MAAIYPYKWSGQFADVNAIAISKNEWQEILNKLTNQEITKGLSACKENKSSFPPTIGEFFNLCMPAQKELGIMAVERAYVSYCNEDYSNPIVRESSKLINRYNWGMSSSVDARREFKSVYKLCVEEFLEEQKEKRLLLTHSGEING